MKDLLSSVPFPVAVSVLVGMMAASLWISSGMLAKRHGDDVRSVWYLWFLVAILATIAASIGTRFGAIDVTGNFHGPGGALFSLALNFAFDLQTDVELYLAIVVLALGPQVGSYLASGILAGCARAPVYASQVVKLFVLSVVKSLVVASGSMAGLIVFGSCHHWIGLDARKATGMISLASTTLAAGLFMLGVYRQISDDTEVIASLMDKALPRRWAAWMSRNVGTA